jgi:hypothetical protein
VEKIFLSPGTSVPTGGGVFDGRIILPDEIEPVESFAS